MEGGGRKGDGDGGGDNADDDQASSFILSGSRLRSPELPWDRQWLAASLLVLPICANARHDEKGEEWAENGE